MNVIENSGIIIQARMGSKRLPGKVMKNINNFPMIYYLLKRVELSNIKIYVATSINKENNILENYINKNFPNIIVFRGNENDVFSRYYEISKFYKLTSIIRITADCPLIDYRIINNMLKIFTQTKDKIDYFSNTTPESSRTYPDGMDVEIFTKQALEKANNLNLNAFELEHVTPCFLNSKYNFISNKIDLKRNLSYLHLSVDYQHNFDLVEKIVKELLVYKIDASLEDIISYFKL